MILDFVIVITLGFIGGAVARRLRQPTVVGYLLAGFIGSLLFSKFVTEGQVVEVIARFGVALLLFTLGLELNFTRLKRVFRLAFVAGVFQILISIAVFRLLLPLFGIGGYEALFIAASFALSSTAVVVKMLNDKGMNDTLPGQVMIAWLLVQDLAVVPLLILLPLFSSKVSAASIPSLLFPLGKATVFVFLLVLLGKRIIPWVFAKVALLQAKELLLAATITICLLIAYVSELVGLSFVLGAFLAGVLVSETTENHAIFSEIRPLRDLFAIIFFVSLPLLVPFELAISTLPTALALSGIVILIKFIIVLFLSYYFGLHSRVSFLVALSLIQVGEFSFVLASEGMAAGLIGEQSYATILSVSIVTIIATPLLFNRWYTIYKPYRKMFKKARIRTIFSKFLKSDELTLIENDQQTLENHVVLCGFGRMGRYIGRALESTRIPYVVVEYDRHIISKLRDSGIRVLYGDPEDRAILNLANVRKARMLIIAVPDVHTQQIVTTNAKSLNENIVVISRTQFEADRRILLSLGVDYLVHPEFEAALTVVSRVLRFFGVKNSAIEGKIARLKIEHGVAS